MSENTQLTAQNVMQAFRAELSDDIQAQIGETGFVRLTMMIDETIQDELKESVLLIEEVLNILRERIEHPEVGM